VIDWRLESERIASRVYRSLKVCFSCPSQIGFAWREVETERSRFRCRQLQIAGTLASLDDADNVRVEPDGEGSSRYGDGALAVLNVKRGERSARLNLRSSGIFQVEQRGKDFVMCHAKQIAVVDRERRSVAATWPRRNSGRTSDGAG